MLKQDAALNTLIGQHAQTLEVEFWLPVPGFEDYEISDLGRVRSTKRNVTRYLNPYDNGEGYPQIDLRQSGRRRTVKTHRLVAELFLPNFEQLPQVNHRDGNKANNAWTNLEWLSGADNVAHAWATGLVHRAVGISGYRGVTWHPSVNLWQARGQKDRKRLDLGRYLTLQEAIDAVKRFKTQ